MPRPRWFLALFGAGLHVCLLSGCIYTSAEKNDFPLGTDSFVEKDTRPPSQKTVDTLAPAPIPQVVEPPPPPPPPAPTPEPTPEPPQPKQSEPAPAPQPPQLPPDPPVIAALRVYLADNPDDTAARALFQHLGEIDRRALEALLPVVASAGKGQLERAELVNQLDLLVGRFRARDSLKVSKHCFTRNIESFGVYDPLPSCPVFHSGLDGRPGERVQVYVEVHNFVSRPIGPCWETSLSSKLEICDVAGNPIEIRSPTGNITPQLSRPARPDRSLSPRQDFFLDLQFHIPSRLPAGHYQLRIEVTDENAPPGGKKGDCRTLDFRVEPPR